MADQQKENKEQLTKEQSLDKVLPEAPKPGERAPEISAAEKNRVESNEKAGNLRGKIEQKPASGAIASAPAKPQKDDTKAKVKIQRLKKLRQADPEAFAQKLDASVKKEVENDNFSQADDQHDETITNARFN